MTLDWQIILLLLLLFLLSYCIGHGWWNGLHLLFTRFTTLGIWGSSGTWSFFFVTYCPLIKENLDQSYYCMVKYSGLVYGLMYIDVTVLLAFYKNIPN